MVLRAAAWPCNVTFEPMLTTESAIEQLFGQVKHIPGSRGSVTTCNSIAAAQLVHMCQSRKPLQAVFLMCSCEVKRVSKCLDSSSERGIYSAPAGLRMLFVSIVSCRCRPRQRGSVAAIRTCRRSRRKHYQDPSAGCRQC